MSFDREEREMHTTTCGDCGNECQVPFKQKKTDLFIAENASKITNQHQEKVAVDLEEDLAGGRSGGFGGDRGSRFGNRDDRPREMHDAKCGDCGTDCQVPFKPKEDRPVYCRDCFQSHKN